MNVLCNIFGHKWIKRLDIQDPDDEHVKCKRCGLNGYWIREFGIEIEKKVIHDRDTANIKQGTSFEL